MTRNDKNGTVDRWLDAGLRQQAQVVPSEGLENRILANLSEQRRSHTYYWRWTPVLAGLIFVVIMAIFWPKQAAQPVIQSDEVRPQPSQAIKSTPEIASQTRRTPPRHATGKSADDATAATAPKLDQFPSPRPLSQQEELLLAYLRQVPKEELKLDLRSDISVKPLSVKNLDIPPLAKLEPGSASDN
jgi:hypothetical protein